MLLASAVDDDYHLVVGHNSSRRELHRLILEIPRHVNRGINNIKYKGID